MSGVFTPSPSPFPIIGEGEQPKAWQGHKVGDTVKMPEPAATHQAETEETAIAPVPDAPVVEHVILRNVTAAMLQEREAQGWQIAFEQFVVVEDRVVHCVRMVRMTCPTPPETKEEPEAVEPEMVILGLEDEAPGPDAEPITTPAAGMTHLQAVIAGYPPDQCMDIARANALAAGKRSLDQSMARKRPHSHILE